MPIKCTIGGVDVSSALKGLAAAPGGDGLIGQGTLVLDQLSGGMDLRPYMEVRVWQTFDAAGNGVASKGRLFGGLVSKRQTGNIGATKIWVLQCSDYNLLLHRIVRDAASAKSITLSAGTFGAQMIQLTTIIQQNGAGAVNTPIDATNGVAFINAMPAVTYEGGHSYGWYIQQLCNTLQSINPAINPHFYMGMTTTFGVGDTFGTPVLNVFNGASLPAIGLSFSDVVAGGRKGYYGTFKRTTDATQTIQRKQSFFSTAHLVATSANATSQSTYPNPFINHGGAANTGYWMDEVSEDRTSTTFAAAQAELDRQIAVSSIPGDTFEFDTEERVLPGDMIGLGNALEGIADDTPYRVVKVSTTVEAAEVINSHLTVNSRRLGLFDDGQAVFAAPVEGDIAPLPPASFAISSNVYNGTYAVMTFAIGASPSPNAVGYAVMGRVGHEQINQNVGTDLAPVLYFTPGLTYDLQAVAYNRDGQDSEGTPAVSLTGTTASDVVPHAPVITNPIASGGSGLNGYIARPVVSKFAGGDDAAGGGVIFWQATSGPTDRPIYSQPIPAGSTFPFRGYADGLERDRQYAFNAVIINAYGTMSANSPTVNFTAGHVPRKDLDPEGWDLAAPDGGLAWWLPVSPSVDADFSIDATVASFNGQSSLKMIMPINVTKQIISPLIETYAGEQIVHAFAVKRGTGTGTAPTASAFVRFFAQDGTTQVGTDTLISAAFIPTTTFPSVPVEGKLTAPAGAFSYAYLFQGVGSPLATSSYNLWWAFPKLKRTITNPAAVELWTDPATPRYIRDVGGVIRGKEYGQSNFVQYLGVNTGGAAPVSIAIQSSTGDSLALSAIGGGSGITSTSAANLSAAAGSTAILSGDGGASSVLAKVGGAVDILGTTTVTGDVVGTQQLMISQAVNLKGVTTKTATFTADATTAIYLCNSASAITANLPTAVGITGRRYTLNNINTGLVTIDGNGSQTIGGLLTYPLPGKCRITFFSDNANWQIESADGLFSASNVYKSSNQTGIAATTFTKVTWNTEVYDLANEFASDKFTCTIPGYYQILATILVDGGAAVVNDQYMARIYKNGSTIGEGRMFNQGTGNYTLIPILIPHVSLAATDYIEIYFWHNNGTASTRDIYGSGNAETAFGVSKVS